MMTKFINYIRQITRRVYTSIAFYPSLISVLFFFLAIFLINFEDNDLTKFLLDKMPFLVINNADTARAILSTLIGGIISLTVFSFSMVMVLLNQASSNFSPRLLPGLISDKRNQYVLGVFLGSIVYNVIVLISILPDGDSYTLNGFSVLIGISFGVFSLAMFVYFIHSISTGIQINHILDRVFSQTKRELNKAIEEDIVETSTIEINEEDRFVIYSDSSKYFEGVNAQAMVDLALKEQINIKVLPEVGKYILPDIALFHVNKEVDDDIRNQLINYCYFSNSPSIQDNFVLGFKYISEVGVKAMSPGINDPGTALITLDYLTELFAMRMQLNEWQVYENEGYKVDLAILSFEQLLSQILTAYRQYCKHDPLLMRKMMLMLRYLKTREAADQSFYKVIETQLDIIRQDIIVSISNDSDKEALLNLADRI